MSELVQKLAVGDHPVEVTLRPERTATALKKRIDEFKFVHIKFTNTRGGTELGVRLDEGECDWSNADFDQASGRIKLSGRLKLDYVPVKCVAEVDLSTLQGSGHLEILQETDVPANKGGNN
jgi:hypothetical protein